MHPQEPSQLVWRMIVLLVYLALFFWSWAPREWILEGQREWEKRNPVVVYLATIWANFLPWKPQVGDGLPRLLGLSAHMLLFVLLGYLWFPIR